MDNKVTQTVDLVPIGIDTDGARVYGSERDAAVIAGCRFLLEHPYETIHVLGLTAVVVVCCCLMSDSNPPRRRNTRSGR